MVQIPLFLQIPIPKLNWFLCLAQDASKDQFFAQILMFLQIHVQIEWILFWLQILQAFSFGTGSSINAASFKGFIVGTCSCKKICLFVGTESFDGAEFFIGSESFFGSFKDYFVGTESFRGSINKQAICQWYCNW